MGDPRGKALGTAVCWFPPLAIFKEEVKEKEKRQERISLKQGKEYQTPWVACGVTYLTKTQNNLTGANQSIVIELLRMNEYFFVKG
jgi:hypothetical protein